MKKERNVFFTGKEENGVPIFRCGNEMLLLVNYSVETVTVELTKGKVLSTKEVIHVLYELLNNEGFENALTKYLFSANQKTCKKAVVKKVKIKHEDILIEATEKVTEQQMYIDFLEKKAKKIEEKREALLKQFSKTTQEYVELRIESDCLRAENLEMRLILQKLRF